MTPSHTMGTRKVGTAKAVKIVSMACFARVDTPLVYGRAGRLIRGPEGSILDEMKEVHWLGRALLFGFVWIFLFGFSYLLLDSLGLWGRLPGALTRALDLLVGLILAGELLGHLVLASGRLPGDSENTRA